MQGDVHDITPRRRLIGVPAALAAVVAGVLVILADLDIPVIVTLVGAGLVVVGLATATGVEVGSAAGPGVRHDPDPHAEDGSGRRDPAGSLFRVTVGVATAVAGIVVLAWRAASIRTLLWVMVAALVLHGIHTVVSALRSGRDGRAAGVLTGTTSLLAALLCLVWPVLSIELVRYIVGAWLVFTGLRFLIGTALPRRRHASGGGTGSGRSRGWIRTTAAAVSLALVSALTIVSAVLLRGDGRPEPGSFYARPESVPAEPGVLLSAETLSEGVPDGADGWRILYTTTDPDGEVTVASGTVVVPTDRGTGALPLLSIAHGTTGIVPRCAPSLSPTPFADGAAAALEEMVTQHGWAGVTSDYVGLGTAGPHQYLVGQAEARNVLDASRAARQLDGVELSSDTVVWGHSQGGHGALWTGQIAGEYAPELTIRGVAGMAPATDLFALAEATKSEVAGKTVSAYIAGSWNEVFPELDLAGHLNPGTAHGVEKIAGLCFNDKDVIAALLRGSQIPEQVFPDALLDGDLGALLRENSPTGPWPAPVLVAQGLADPLVKPEMQQNWVDGRCAAGDPIDYRTYPGLDHMGLVAPDSPLTPQLVQWTLDRWAGAAPTPTC